MLFDLASLQPVPWKNGAGLTRPVGQSEDALGMRWRVSVADLTQAADFSVFPGVDRVSVLVQADQKPFSLHPALPPDACAQGSLGLPLNFEDIGSEHRYPGERLVRNEAPRGLVRLLNLMIRREVFEVAPTFGIQSSVEVQPGRSAVVLAVHSPVLLPAATPAPGAISLAADTGWCGTLSLQDAALRFTAAPGAALVTIQWHPIEVPSFNASP